MCYDGYFGGSRHYFLATGCERRQEQKLDPGEFVTAGEVALGDLVRLAMTGGRRTRTASCWRRPTS